MSSTMISNTSYPNNSASKISGVSKVSSDPSTSPGSDYLIALKDIYKLLKSFARSQGWRISIKTGGSLLPPTRFHMTDMQKSYITNSFPRQYRDLVVEIAINDGWDRNIPSSARKGLQKEKALPLFNEMKGMIKGLNLSIGYGLDDSLKQVVSIDVSIEPIRNYYKDFNARYDYQDEINDSEKRINMLSQITQKYLIAAHEHKLSKAEIKQTLNDMRARNERYIKPTLKSMELPKKEIEELNIKLNKDEAEIKKMCDCTVENLDK